LGVVCVSSLANAEAVADVAVSKGRKMNILNYKIIFVQKNKIINNCDLLKAHNFCNGVQLWLLAAGTKQLSYTTS
jgi:hypothetical protein